MAAIEQLPEGTNWCIRHDATYPQVEGCKRCAAEKLEGAVQQVLDKHAPKFKMQRVAIVSTSPEDRAAKIELYFEKYLNDWLEQLHAGISFNTAIARSLVRVFVRMGCIVAFADSESRIGEDDMTSTMAALEFADDLLTKILAAAEKK